MHKILHIIAFLFAVTICRANMASPYESGTLSGCAFSSRSVDILGEKITISPNKDFSSAFYDVEYTISSSSSYSHLIPLLFYALDYKGDFKVWLDGNAIPIQQIPEKYVHFKGSPFYDFERYNGNATQGSYHPGMQDHTALAFEWYDTDVSINDLKFFQAKISKGIHKIRVTYFGSPTVYRKDWIAKYIFEYSLSPAKLWKSFGTLEVKLVLQNSDEQVETNLGKPEGNTGGLITTWKFTNLPQNYISITYTPKVSLLAQVLIFLSPFTLSLVIFSVLVFLHVRFIRMALVKKSNKMRRIYTLGIFIVPAMYFLGYLYCYEIIDVAIGKYAGRRHGYIFMVVLLYPVLLAGYWMVASRIFEGLVNKYERTQQ